MTARELKRRVPRKAAIGIGLTSLMLVVASAFAVHDEKFQLDRDTEVDAPGSGPFANTLYDWESFFTDPDMDETGIGNSPTAAIPSGSGFTDVEFVEDWSLVNGVYQTGDPTTFTQSHDYENIGGSGGWRCKEANQVTNKGDITNTYVGVYEEGGKKILYFALEKDQDSGSNNVGLWLLQDGTVACEGGGSGNGNAFTGTHMVNDVFLVSEFTNGGGVSSIKAYKWVEDIDPKVNVTTPGLDPTPFAASADCVLSPGQPGYDDKLCATSNLEQFSPNWTHWNFDLGVNSGLKPATFVEGAISIGEFPDFANACFNKFLFNTRSSPSLTATLYDYSLGSIGTCDGNISIATSGTNVLGAPHTFTVVANSVGAPVPTGWAITISESGPGSVVTNNCSSIEAGELSNGGKTATCTVVVDNDVAAGTSTVNAEVVITYAGGTTVTRSTAGNAGSGGSGPATKTWVDAQIDIATSGTNVLGGAHTFTVTVQQDDGIAAADGGDGVTGWAPAVGVAVNPSESGVGAITGGTCNNSAPDTNASGQCTIIVDSDVLTGVSTVGASSSFSISGVAGSATVNVSTNGTGNNSANATKTWVDAQITIAASATNNITEGHTFTVTVQKDDGQPAGAPGDGATGFGPAAGVTVSISLDASSTLSVTPTGTCVSGTTNSSGQCTVIVQSNLAGTVVIDASATVSVAGLVGSANVAVDVEGYGAYGTIGRTKTWVDGSLTWLKHDGAGALLGGAVFTVCRTHTFNSDTLAMDDITDVCIDVSDEDDSDANTSSPDQDLTLGEFELQDLVLGRYTIVEKTPPPGYHGDPKTETVNLTILSPDGSAASPFVNLRAFRLIVIGCDDITDTLEETEVWIDLNDDEIVDPGEVMNTITAVPQHLVDLGVTEADICGTDDDQDDIPSDGIGGASYGGLAPATYRSTMQIPL